MRRASIHLFIFVIVLLLGSANAAHAADMAVIVNKANMSAVDRSMVEKIYKAEMASWPGGGAIIAIDLPESSDDRSAFTSMLLGKTVSNVKALWTMKLFSGKATPPKIVNSDAEVKSAVAGNKNAIGYIRASSLDDSVKAVVTVR